MQTEREYLASLTPPLAIPGARGRFSREGKAALEKAKAEGMVFASNTPAVSPVKKAATKAFKSAAKEWHEGAVKPIVPKAERPVSWETPTPSVRPDRKFEAFTTASGIKKSYKDCCNKCGISIAWCHCPVAFVFDKDNETLVPLSPIESTRNLTLA